MTTTSPRSVMPCVGAGSTLVVLVGEPGIGKTHLARAAGRATTGRCPWLLRVRARRLRHVVRGARRRGRRDPGRRARRAGPDVVTPPPGCSRRSPPECRQIRSSARRTQAATRPWTPSSPCSSSSVAGGSWCSTTCNGPGRPRRRSSTACCRRPPGCDCWPPVACPSRLRSAARRPAGVRRSPSRRRRRRAAPHDAGSVRRRPGDHPAGRRQPAARPVRLRRPAVDGRQSGRRCLPHPSPRPARRARRGRPPRTQRRHRAARAVDVRAGRRAVAAAARRRGRRPAGDDPLSFVHDLVREAAEATLPTHRRLCSTPPRRRRCSAAVTCSVRSTTCSRGSGRWMPTRRSRRRRRLRAARRAAGVRGPARRRHPVARGRRRRSALSSAARGSGPAAAVMGLRAAGRRAPAQGRRPRGRAHRPDERRRHAARRSGALPRRLRHGGGSRSRHARAPRCCPRRRARRRRRPPGTADGDAGVLPRELRGARGRGTGGVARLRSTSPATAPTTRRSPRCWPTACSCCWRRVKCSSRLPSPMSCAAPLPRSHPCGAPSRWRRCTATRPRCDSSSATAPASSPVTKRFVLAARP